MFLWAGAAGERLGSPQAVSFVFKDLLPLHSCIFDRLPARGGGRGGKSRQILQVGIWAASSDASPSSILSPGRCRDVLMHFSIQRGTLVVRKEIFHAY